MPFSNPRFGCREGRRVKVRGVGDNVPPKLAMFATSPSSLTDTLVTLLASTARGPRSIHETLKKVYVLWVY
jgi:hypothetical protein